MPAQKSIIGTLIDTVREELFLSKGPERFLLLTLFANIPTPLIFIPYFTQAATIVLLCFYVAHVTSKTFSTGVTISRASGSLRIVIFALILIAIFLQIFWIPFMTQLYTLALVGIAYALSKNILS